MLIRDKVKYPGLPFSGITVKSVVRDTYKLINGELVVTGKEDIKEIVQSSREQALDAILDRFLDGTANLEDYSSVQNPVFLDDGYMKDTFELHDEYVAMMEDTREALKLPEDMPYDKISSYLEQKYNEFKEVSKNGTKITEAPSSDAENVEQKDVSADVSTEA